MSNATRRRNASWHRYDYFATSPFHHSLCLYIFCFSIRMTLVLNCQWSMLSRKTREWDFHCLFWFKVGLLGFVKDSEGPLPPLSFFSAAIITLVSVTPALDLRQTQEPQIKYKLFYKVTGFSTHHCRENVQAYSLVSYLFLCCIKYL